MDLQVWCGDTFLPPEILHALYNRIEVSEVACEGGVRGTWRWNGSCRHTFQYVVCDDRQHPVLLDEVLPHGLEIVTLLHKF